MTLDERDLPPLPAGNSVCAEAVRSVVRRGFYEEYPAVVYDPALMAQFLRWVEEVGELVAASATMKMDKIEDESADVVIVAAQHAWLHGVELDTLLEAAEYTYYPSLSILLGEYARSLRKGEGIERCIGQIVHFVRQHVGVHGINLETAIPDKLQRDERRGVRHEQG